MSSVEEFERRDLRRRQARAEAAREVARLEREAEAAASELDDAAAKLRLGEGDDEDVIEAEASLDVLARRLRRAKAAWRGLE